MKKIFLTISMIFLLLISVSGANAFTIIDSWNLNLSVLNGKSFGTGDTVSGLSNAIGIDHVNMAGYATISQTVVNGSALNQPFVDSGFLQFSTWAPEGGSFTNNFGNAKLYVEYVGLSGILNNDTSITFDTGVQQNGTINFYLTEDNDGIHATNQTEDLLLASFNLLSPSGGSNLDFYGGASGDSNVGLTLGLQESTLIDDDLFTDVSGNSLKDSAKYFHLVNTNSLLDTNFDPNPNNTDINSGSGVSVINVQNNGQYNLAVVPEPATLMLLGFGLLGIACISRKKMSV